MHPLGRTYLHPSAISHRALTPFLVTHSTVDPIVQKARSPAALLLLALRLSCHVNLTTCPPRLGTGIPCAARLRRAALEKPAPVGIETPEVAR